ncbi:hypothetical protein RvY_03495 [Ramazzottius varieornatus]|uniref:Ionotropic glutamate receptor C-terminal domain-containing protein n=1 Tax=Ramazzottius varieornatus TaxID=947166 RepID=A0A1D1UYE9_RAMVA|nr:hypothetical protein RvY_03495 [Ramazzottius varieornatus]
MNAIIPYQLAVSAMLVPPFSTLPNFLSNPDFVAYGNKAVRESMLDSKDEVLRQFATRMNAINNSQNYYEFMTRNSSSKEVYLAHKEGEILLANYSCDFVEAVPNVLSLTIAPLWFKRDSDIYYKFAPRFERLLSEKLVDSDLGYYRESSYDVLRRANKSKNLCIAKPLPGNPDLGNRGLNLVDLTLPFVGIMLVNIVACVALLLEILVYRFSHRRIRPMTDQSNLDSLHRP